MIRDGKYGLYNGQEYMLAGKKDDLEIISNDPAELLNGFIQDDWDENIFFKNKKKTWIPLMKLQHTQNIKDIISSTNCKRIKSSYCYK